MAEKRYVVKLPSEGDGESYYNTGNDDGAPNAFAGSLFKALDDAKCMSKCKQGIVCELEPKELRPPKPRLPIEIFWGISLAISIEVSLEFFFGISVLSPSRPPTHYPPACPPIHEPLLEECVDHRYK